MKCGERIYSYFARHHTAKEGNGSDGGSEKKAEEQSFLKSRFLAAVSHDLRSPLHAIIGGSDILKKAESSG